MPLVRITSNNFLSRKIRHVHRQEEIYPLRDVSRLCKSRRKRSSSSFLLIVWPYKEKCGGPAAKWAKRGQGQCSTCHIGIGDRQWRKRIRELVIWRGYGWIEPAVFLSPRKSPRGWMGSLVRGETARSHWSRSIILRYIFVGSVDTRQKREEEGSSRAASRCRWQIVFASSLRPFRYNSRSIFDPSFFQALANFLRDDPYG